ncbi:MAG: glycosyltransferase family 4 protein [Deltaproteobacteria bacterium]|nr:glycosyltransferase family 4 protein [Deltaproteobacteria bacterium]
MNVLVLATNGRDEASTRYRFYQYAPALEARGHSFELSAFYPALPSGSRSLPKKLRSWAGGIARQLVATLRSGRFDVVIVQRYVAPAVINEIARLVRTPIVYDFDDALWLSEKRPECDALCARARLVVAGNEYLAAHARTTSARVQVIPTVVDTDRFVPRAHTSDGPPVIGWIGSPSTFPYLDAMLPVLDALARTKSFRLRVIGAPRPLRLQNLRVEQPEWSDAAEPTLFSELDIGLYPLADDAWSRGKCGLKSIQYMACGVAHVASPVGVVREISADNETALWATTPEEWTRAIGRLLDDGELRARLTTAARARVVDAYSLRASTADWLAAIEGAAR